jgi:hypothetical protein
MQNSTGPSGLVRMGFIIRCSWRVTSRFLINKASELELIHASIHLGMKYV